MMLCKLHIYFVILAFIFPKKSKTLITVLFERQRDPDGTVEKELSLTFPSTDSCPKCLY